MTDRIAIYLVAFIAIAILVDLQFNDMQGSLFLARKFASLTEFIAFWR